MRETDKPEKATKSPVVVGTITISVTALAAYLFGLCGCATTTVDQRCDRLRQSIEAAVVGIEVLEGQCRTEECEKAVTASKAALASSRSVYESECPKDPA